MRFSDTLSSWITIEGERCSEYAFASSSDDKHVSCWIASEAGKSFQIHFKDTPTVPMDYSLRIDGKSCPGKVLRTPDGLPYTGTVEGKRISATMRRPFMFSPINHSDDDSLLLNSVNGIGDIVLSVCPGVFRPSTKQYSGVPTEVTFHERMKKGIDHHTSFGAPEIVKAGRRYRSRLIGIPVTLTFKYRPLAVLQANGIAPPPPRTNSVVNEDDDSEVEIVESTSRTSGVKREKNRTRPSSSVKREPNRNGVSPHKKAKREPRSQASTEVIDLT